MDSGLAQGSPFEWVRLIEPVSPRGTTNRVSLEDIATDRSGHIYVNGNFAGVITFGTTNLSSPSLRGSSFLAKYDLAGKLLWVVSQNASEAGNSLGVSGLAVDSLGNSYTCGWIYPDRFDTVRDYIVAKHDAFGREVWSHRWGHSDTNVDDYAWKIAIGKSGQSFVVGGTTGGAVGRGAFSVMKHDMNGLRAWVADTHRTGRGYASFSDVAVDPSGNVWAIGWYNDTIVVGDVTLPVVGGSNILLVKYDGAGRLLALKQFGQTAADQVSVGHGIACDGHGNVFVKANFTGTASFGTTNLTSTSMDDTCLLKADPAGNVIWVRQIRGDSNGWSSRLATNPSGSVLLASLFRGSIDFGTMSLTSRGEGDVVVACYGPDGDFEWARQGGGPGNESARSFAADDRGCGYVIGPIYGSSATFGATNFALVDGAWFIAKTSPTLRLMATTAGGGTVQLSPEEGSYLSGTTVTLTAQPDAGWTFLHWLGDGSGTNATNQVVVNRDKWVKAVFGTALNTTVEGGGSILARPVLAHYPYGSDVQLMAVPEAGHAFAYWGNDATGPGSPLRFIITNAHPTVAASFASLSAGEFALNVVVEGLGVVTANPVGNRFTNRQVVTLTAAADADQQFLGWSGDASGTENPLHVETSQSKIIVARFTSSPRLSVPPGAQFFDEGGFRFWLSGMPGARYDIETREASEPWAILTTVTNRFGTIQLNDGTAPHRPRRVYRAVILP